jgi:hypothetical protein
MTQKADQTKLDNSWDKVDFSLALLSCANRNHETNTSILFIHGSFDWRKVYHCRQKLTMFVEWIQIDCIVGNGNWKQGKMIMRHLHLLMMFEH